MILKYIASVIMILCVWAIDVMLWVLFYGFIKKKDSNYIIISLVGALAITAVLVYLIGNPSAWIPL